MTTPQASWMVLVLIGVAIGADAASQDSAPAPATEFLEFLGTWHTGDDRWIDPFHVSDAVGPKDGERSYDTQRPEERGETNMRPGSRDHAKERQGVDPAMPQREMKP